MYFDSSFISISSITEWWNSVFSLLALSFPECREEEPNKLGLSNGERKETEFQHSVILDIDIKEEPKYNHKHLKQKEISNSQSTMNIKRNDKEIEE